MSQPTRPKQVCPHCMGWMLDAEDPFLLKWKWKKCRTCGYSERFDAEKMRDSAQALEDEEPEALD